MKLCNSTIRIRTEPGFYIYIALLFLLLPVQWIVALTVSTIVHELGHFTALRLMRIPIEAICIRPLGIFIETPPMESKKELFCASAGPAFGLSLLLLSRLVPEIALFALFQSLYNLLPVYPADGGRILHGLCRLLFPVKLSAKIEKIISYTVITLCIAVGFYGTMIAKMGILPCILGAAITVNAVKKQK